MKLNIKCLSKLRQKVITPLAEDNNFLMKLKLPSYSGDITRQKVDDILKGKLFTLNLDFESIKKFDGRWGGRFWSDIRYERDPVDIRAVLEPSRLQHLSILLFYTWNATMDEQVICRIKTFVREKLLAWLVANPFPYGPNYISVLECALRIPVFFYVLRAMDAMEKCEKQMVLNAMYEHAWWISRRLSLYSSLGNHTVAESLGLIYAGAVFQNRKDGKSWLKRGIELLERELSHQILEDGGPAEQSFWYHRFILDLYWIAVDFLESNAIHDCDSWKKVLSKGERFVSAFVIADNVVPSIGDSDDGYAIAPGIFPRRRVSSCKKKAIQSFSLSGYTAIRTATNDCLIFDHGPLGMAPLYAHGHADALSITLNKDGVEILVDPGTYRYNGEPEFRLYFKGTRAHNTVTVDGFDQAVQETGFIWSHPYKAQLTRSEATADGLSIEGCHDGYRRLKDPVEHRRVITFFGADHLLILDKFFGAGVHDFELNYHLHSEIVAKRQDGWWNVDRGKEAVFIRQLKGEDFILIVGQEKPPFGWFSPAYGVKVKSGVLSCRKRGSAAEISFLTAISLGEPLAVDAYLERAAAL